VSGSPDQLGGMLVPTAAIAVNAAAAMLAKCFA